MSERRGDWLQTFLGVQFFPLDPRPEDIHLEDIAVALSNLNRFGGHTRWPYSVGQHSILVANHCLRTEALAGLLHDATEAYLVDVPRPIKRHLGGYVEIESRLATVIGERFGVSLNPLSADVHRCDEEALATEKRDLLCKPPAAWAEPQGGLAKPWEEVISPWDPITTRKLFLRTAEHFGLKVNWSLVSLSHLSDSK